MIILTGLGNPGYEYDSTRHNIGFRILDRLSEDLRIRLRPGKGDYLFGVGSFTAVEVGLLKPLTFMNNSGEAVLDIRNRYDIPLERFLILCDDFQLPLGQLRLRPDGSDGGHNGLSSVIYHLKSNSFPRLRCGIASEHMPSDKTTMARFVLDPFDRNEQTVVSSMIDRAVEASLCVLSDGLESAMNRYNRKLNT